MKSFLALSVCLILSTLSLGSGSVAVAGGVQSMPVEAEVDCDLGDDSQGIQMKRGGVNEWCKLGCKICVDLRNYVVQEECRSKAYRNWLDAIKALNAQLANAEPNSAEWDRIYKQIEDLMRQGPDYSHCG